MSRLLTIALGGLLMLTGVAGVAQPVKQRPTLWSEEELAAARAQAGEVDPGPYAALDLEALWNLVPPTTIPRKHAVDHTAFCPVHGRLPNPRAWRMDFINRPFQVQCPIGGEWYPNADYPDDGSGYQDAEGRTYHFLRFYVGWAYLTAVVDTALPQLSRAYALTGEQEYARKAAVLLVRIAREMPNDTTRRDRCYGGEWGHWAGLITDYVWEAIRLRTHAEAYELIFAALDDDEELVRFIQGKDPALDTGPKIRECIEDELLRVGAQAIIEEVLNGNPGFPQLSGITLAAVLDDFGEDKRPNSRDLLEWLYYGWGNFRFIFSNFLYPDGGGLESPGYSKIMLDLFLTADRLEKYRRLVPQSIPQDRYPNLLAHPKIRPLFDFHIDLWRLAVIQPAIGDCGGYFHGRRRPPHTGVVWTPRHFEAYARAFNAFGDPRYARVVVGADGNLRWDDPLEPLDVTAFREAAQSVGPLFPTRTELFDGYGLAFLHSGEGEFGRDAWLYYGAMRTHGHNDPMNLGLYAFRRALLCDLGYPLQLAAPYRMWEHHIWTHNTVIVDDGYPYSPGLSWGTSHVPHGVVERIHDFRDAGAPHGVQVIQVDCPIESVESRPEQPRIDRYRRTVASVDVSPTRFYVVDFFQVTGGQEHHLCYHFPHGPVTTGGVDLQDKPGTLAGEDIGYAERMMDVGGTQYIDPRSCMENVRRGDAQGPYWVRWDAADDEAVQFRIHHLPQEGTEAILADGRPPAHPDRYQKTFMYARRTGDLPLSSAFVSVLEACSDGELPVVRAERLALAGEAVAVRVETTRGVDLVIFNPAGEQVELPEEQVRTDAEFAVVRRDGQATDGWMSGGTYLVAGGREVWTGAPRLQATISGLDREARSVTVALPEGVLLTGRWISIGNDGRTTTYRVVDQRPAPGGEVELTLDVTSLLSEGTVRDTGDHIIFNDVAMPFGGIEAGRVIARELMGATVVGAGEALRVYNVEYGNFFTKRADWNVHISRDHHPEATAASLAEQFPAGTEFQVYDYTVGDTVTVVNAARLPAE